MYCSDNIKNIIFDLGAVVLDIDFNRTINAYKSLGIKDFDNIFTQAKQDEIFDNFERGQVSPETFRAGLRKIAGTDLKDSDIDEAWNDIIIGFPEANIKLLEKAKKHYRTFLLSNTNAIHFPVYNALLEPYGYNHISELFEKIFLSHEIGMRKPEPEIFNFVINDRKIKPEETLYIDDTLSYLPVAQKLGIKTRHFIQWENKLTDLFDQEGFLLQ